ncbi:MAG: sigma factor-like helix-turn-helix DNA-binding protein, partial [Bacteroidales bacterium]
LKSRVDGKKYSEIASDLGISVNTVKYHIKNALAALTIALEKFLVIILFFSLK